VKTQIKRNALLFLLSVLVLPVAQAYEPAGTPEDWPSPIPDQRPYAMLLIDRFEAGHSDTVDKYVWDAQGWYGGDFNRLWLKSEGEGTQGDSPESAELQALFSHKFSPFWDWQLGVRHDFRPSPTRTHAVIGLQGLIPYEFEWDSALFISEAGDLTARVEAEYDLRITQRLIVQPRLELNAAAAAVPERGLGSGINSSEFGIRLRYEFRREFAPFIGVSWEKRYGDTADFAKAEGENVSDTFFVVGVRAWF
jgi:copper resistance protein B